MVKVHSGALTRLYPGLVEKLIMLVLHASRAPRPEERDDLDYHFRSRKTPPSFVEILRGNEAPFARRWERDFL